MWVAMRLDEHYRRYVNIAHPEPTIHYLSISSEDARVAYQRFLRLAQAYNGESWLYIDNKHYGLFNDNFQYVELCCVERNPGDCPMDTMTTIWKCDAPEEWYSHDYDDVENTEIPTAFVEEFFEFVRDYSEE